MPPHAGWAWDDRHKGSARKVAAADAKEAQTSCRLTKLQHKLLTQLTHFLNANAETVNVLVANEDAALSDYVQKMIDQAATSNAHLGFQLPLKLYTACDRVGVLATMRTSRIEIVILGHRLLDDYNRHLMSEMPSSQDSSAVFVVQCSNSDASITAAELESFYEAFGVQDQLMWPPTLESTRRMLHQWMPRATTNVAGTPLPGSRCSSLGNSLLASPMLTGSRSLRTSRDETTGPSGLGPQGPVTLLRVPDLPLPSPALVPATPTQVQVETQDTSGGSPSADGSMIDSMPAIVAMPSPAQSPARHRLRSRSASADASAADALSCALRVLVVASSQLSAATSMHYCEIFLLWADYAPDAESAMARLSADSAGYDLVIVEPDFGDAMSGYALCAWWKEHAAMAAARTEFAALSEVPDAEACKAFGIEHCLAKPLSVHCFASILKSWLERKA